MKLSSRVMTQKLGNSARWILFSLFLVAPMACPAQTSSASSVPPKTPSEKPVSPNSVTKGSLESPHYHPITGKQRVDWFFIHTVGPHSLLLGVVTAGFGTARDKPEEYGPHWEGFGKRYAMRFTGVATGNAMEATFGSLSGEDPRYFRTSGQPFSRRIRNVVVMTFLTRRRDGHYVPAYARLIATPGNNFLSNTWRADSEANAHSALVRTLLGFAGRIVANTYQEFHPTFSHPIPRD